MCVVLRVLRWCKLCHVEHLNIYLPGHTCSVHCCQVSLCCCLQMGPLRCWTLCLWCVLCGEWPNVPQWTGHQFAWCCKQTGVCCNIVAAFLLQLDSPMLCEVQFSGEAFLDNVCGHLVSSSGALHWHCHSMLCTSISVWLRDRYSAPVLLCVHPSTAEQISCCQSICILHNSCLLIISADRHAL